MRRLCCLALLLSACARGGDTDPDTGVRPPPTTDSGVRDAGTLPGVDGGETDAEVPPLVDSGVPMGVDSGAADSGVSPACMGVDCSGLDGPCVRGVCDPGTGACGAQPRADGTACDDGDACTMDDACAAGACGGAAADCSAMDGPCVIGTCDPSLGCTTAPRADGADCDADPSDCVAETCQAGACTGAPAADCSACASGGTVCAGGACGAAPTTLTYDFEGGMPGGWTPGGTAGWVVDGSRTHGGAMAAHSGAITHSQSSTLTAVFDLSSPAELAFWYTTSTESGFDYLEIWVDGARQGRWAGTLGWTQTTVSLGGAGRHTVEWRYTKDGSVSSGDDRVWIDDVVIRSGGGAEGFEGASLPAGYTTTGDASWRTSTAQAHGGARSAESGTIGHNQVTSLHHTVMMSAAGNISFWRRTSTESGFDYLEFYLDGTRMDRWSGTTSWAQSTYPVGAGMHTLEWRYDKDGSVSSGSDAVWIDDVVAGDPVAAMPICGP